MPVELPDGWTVEAVTTDLVDLEPVLGECPCESVAWLSRDPLRFVQVVVTADDGSPAEPLGERVSLGDGVNGGYLHISGAVVWQRDGTLTTVVGLAGVPQLLG